MTSTMTSAMTSKQPGVAVIVDLVGSRALSDRSLAQKAVLAALATVNESLHPLQPLAPTVGDEYQGLYSNVASALQATLMLRLLLPEPFDCRFGIGVGDYVHIGRSDYGPIQDGSAWWSARDAIVETKRRETQQHRSLRTWMTVADDVENAAGGIPSPAIPSPAMTNAYLLCRDELVGNMNARSRRLLLGLIQGRTQMELALAEGISQSAVSQNLSRSGAHAVLGSAVALGSMSR